jgi:hypothetical protein
MANDLIAITNRINERLGFTNIPGGKVSAPDSQNWDCGIGNLTFLYGMSDQNPMMRETAEFRRERIDTERLPGEQSLDSGYWVRSQESWHYGAGLTTAEPLEIEATESRFRYAQSGGVDPWTPGQLRLLKDTTEVEDSSSTQISVLGTTEGILVWDDSGLHMLLSDGSVSWTYADALITSFTTDGESWYAGRSDGKIYTGPLASGGGSLHYDSTIAGKCLVRWIKGRLIATFDVEVWEGAGATWTQIDSGATFPADWEWMDAADGPTSIYVTGYSGYTSEIYKIDVSVSGTTVTLGALTSVAEMPRSETIYTTYSYVGSFIMLGTSKGVRVAAIGDTGALGIGPLIRESDTGVRDFVAVGSYVYAALGSDANSGDRDTAPGLVRVNLGQTLNNNALQFAIADDLIVNDGTECQSVTFFNNKVVIGVAEGGVYEEADTYVSSGWLETGRIRLGTTEAKTWRDLRLLQQPDSDGAVAGHAIRDDDSSAPSSWQQVVQTDGSNYDLTGKISSNPNEPATDLYVALHLQASADSSGTPVLQSYQLRAIPSPVRTRLVRVPLMLFDRESDRSGSVMGYPGYAYDRLQLLEALEQEYALVPYEDYTTGERVNVYIERVSYSRTAPPTHNEGNNGGIVTLLLRLV